MRSSKWTCVPLHSISPSLLLESYESPPQTDEPVNAQQSHQRQYQGEILPQVNRSAAPDRQALCWFGLRPGFRPGRIDDLAARCSGESLQGPFINAAIGLFAVRLVDIEGCLRLGDRLAPGGQIGMNKVTSPMGRRELRLPQPRAGRIGGEEQWHTAVVGQSYRRGQSSPSQRPGDSTSARSRTARPVTVLERLGSSRPKTRSGGCPVWWVDGASSPAARSGPARRPRAPRRLPCYLR
jgi:hypothetical protein